MVASWKFDPLRLAGAVFGATLSVAAAFGSPAFADPGTRTVEVAAALPLSGEGIAFGEPSREGLQFGIDEANARGVGPRIDLKFYDDRSSQDGARAAARQIVASKAVMVLGPSYSSQTLAAGPIYADAGMVVLPPTATSDAITQNATTFRIVFKNSDQGRTLATYLSRVLKVHAADVVVEDTSYGQTLRAGFEQAAARLGLAATYFPFDPDDVEQGEAIARVIAADPAQPPVAMLTLDTDGARILEVLRRFGAKGTVLGDDSFGGDTFSGLLANRPEERRQPGTFTDGVYGIAPMILDSANADTLAFAERFRARFGHEPSWIAVASYDAARLAGAAVRATTTGSGAYRDVAALRLAVQTFLVSLNDPDHAVAGLLGPIWFDAAHGRQQAIRVGRFSHGHFESAPLQIVPVTNPDEDDVTSGAVFEMMPGRYARLQRVVYTGMFVNEIPRLDVSKSRFGADFYFWLRFARDAGPGSADPTEITFPNMLSGSFDRKQPAEQGEMPDGTEYRLWRVQGDFRNDFDLHRFPFDRQSLGLDFFNARAAADKIVYVLDTRELQAPHDDRLTTASATRGSALAATATPSSPSGALPSTSPDAFRNLTQWAALATSQRRESLVTESALGDPRRGNAESFRELSGFLMTIEVERRTVATLVKNLLPLALMTMIMFASLYFPHGLVKEKVTVAVTGALSGAVLLTAINNQLGPVGYTIAVEYAFYVFFCLSLLCIVSVLGAERLRVAGRAKIAALTDEATRILFLLAVAGTLAVAAAMWLSGASAQ